MFSDGKVNQRMGELEFNWAMNMSSYVQPENHRPLKLFQPPPVTFVHPTRPSLHQRPLLPAWPLLFEIIATRRLDNLATHPVVSVLRLVGREDTWALKIFVWIDLAVRSGRSVRSEDCVKRMIGGDRTM